MKNIYLGVLLLVAHMQFVIAQVYTTDQINEIGDWEGFSAFSIQASPFTAVDGDKAEEHQLNGISWTNGNKLKAFTIFNPQATNPPMAERWLKPRSGNNLLLFSCNYSKDADNWIITPKVKLKNGTPKLEFYIQNYYTYWQRYQIWVSTTTNDISSFKQISDGDYLEASGNVPNNSELGWKRISFDLSAYANQDVYIAIHHITPGEGVMMAIDDLKIVYGEENVELPIVDFIADNSTISAGETVTFTDQSKNSPSSWKWKFLGGNPSTSTDKNPAIVYDYPGKYMVELSVTNANGTVTNTKSEFIAVESKLKADFSSEKIEAYEGESISFNDFSLGNPTTWEWTLSGSSTPSSTEQNPVVTYANSGTYDVKLKVSDGINQDVNTKTAYIVIKPASTPEVDFSANITSIEEGSTVQFKEETKGGGLVYNWTFEGASPPVSNERNPKITYYNEGSYKVTLKVSNEKGEDTLAKENYITVTQIEPDYCTASSEGDRGVRGISNVQIGTINNSTESKSYTYYNKLQTKVEKNGSYPITIKTTGGFSVDENGKGNKVAVWVDWNQDGDFFDANEKVLVMNNDGDNNYSGTIDVPSNAKRRKSRMRIRSFFSFKNGDEESCGENPEGEVEDYNLYIDATDIKPIADFKSNTQSVPSGSFVNFEDTSQNNVTGWEWSFEGGTPSISYDKAPQIKYITPGKYSVTLKVSNIAGSDSKVRESYIIVTQGDIISTCNDGIQNGDETGVDCGGSCQPCVIVDGGKVSTSDGVTEITTVTGDGVPDVITFAKESLSTVNYIYVITDDTGKILTTEATSHNFEGATPGICRVYGISYQGNIDVTNKNITDQGLATGNFDISTNWIKVTRVKKDPNPTCDDGIQNGDETGIDCGGSCEPCTVVDGGTVSTDDDKTEVTTVTGDGNADVIRFKTSSSATANYIYIITDDTGKILTTETTSHNFEGSGVGVCRVYGISYEGILEVTDKNVTDSGLATGDFNISTNWITVTRVEKDPDPTCDDGIQNGDETGVDCGGTCKPCNTLVYCTAGSNSATDEYISNVVLGTGSNASTNSPNGYGDYTSTVFTSLSKKQINTITITPTWASTVYNEGYGVWIDYNQDGDFEDDGEQVFSKAPSKDTSVIGEFTVPDSATNGKTRMRVSMAYNTIPQACGIVRFGEIEDYTVNITNDPIPTCTDGIQNGDETGIDCGGSCMPCASLGTIVYVDIEDKTVSAMNTWNPFQIEIGDEKYFGPWFTGNTIRLVTYGKDLICKGTTNNISLIGEDSMIDASGNFVSNSNSFIMSSSDYTDWKGKSGYIGFSFKINEAIHYGWFYATVTNDGLSYTIKDYAYNTTAGQGLLTTREGIKSNNNQYRKAIIYPNPFTNTATINVSNLGDQGFAMTIYNVLGKVIYEKVYSKNTKEVILGENIISQVGNYYIKIISDNISEYHSVIKK